MNIVLNRLNRSLNNGFSPEKFLKNMRHILNQYMPEDQVMKMKCGISDVDIIAFGYLKIKSFGQKFIFVSKEAEALIESSLSKSIIANHFIDISPYDNERITFAEFYLLDISRSQSSYSQKYLSIVNDVVNIGEDINSRSRFIIGYLALKFSGCKSSRCDFIARDNLKSAVRHFLHEEVGKLDSFEFNNLIDSALDLDIPLAQIKLKDNLALRDVVGFYFDDEVNDKFESACQRQEALEIINENADKIDHNFNPDMYFDF